MDSGDFPLLSGRIIHWLRRAPDGMAENDLRTLLHKQDFFRESEIDGVLQSLRDKKIISNIKNRCVLEDPTAHALAPSVMGYPQDIAEVPWIEQRAIDLLALHPSDMKRKRLEDTLFEDGFRKEYIDLAVESLLARNIIRTTGRKHDYLASNQPGTEIMFATVQSFSPRGKTLILNPVFNDQSHHHGRYAFRPLMTAPIIMRRKNGARLLEPGDTVLVKTRRHDNYLAGEFLQKVDDPADAMLLGRIQTGHGSQREFRLVGRKSIVPIPIALDNGLKANDGDVVEARFTLSPRQGNIVSAIALRTAWTSKSKPCLADIPVVRSGLSRGFAKPVQEEAREAVKRNENLAKDRRYKDMTAIPLVAIDPEGAKDHDDAVHAEIDPENPKLMKLTVAIADVSDFVRPGTALDKEAFKRAQSHYFWDRYIPMLPSFLSGDACSLKPGTDKKAMVATLWIDRETGEKVRHQFDLGRVRVKHLLTYPEANDILADAPRDKPHDARALLQQAHDAFNLLYKARLDRRAFPFEDDDCFPVFDDKGKVVGFDRKLRGIAEKMIEEFMIGANIAAAETLEETTEGGLGRHHPEADTSLDEIEDIFTPDAPLSKDVIKTRAFYSPDQFWHSALQTKYTHFTSPIRRYADLVVHRQLIAALKLDPTRPDPGYTFDKVKTIAAHVNHVQDKDRSIQSEIVARHLLAFLQGKVNGDPLPVEIGRIYWDHGKPRWLELKSKELPTSLKIPVNLLEPDIKQAVVNRSVGEGTTLFLVVTQADAVDGTLAGRLVRNEASARAFRQNLTFSDSSLVFRAV